MSFAPERSKSCGTVRIFPSNETPPRTILSASTLPRNIAGSFTERIFGLLVDRTTVPLRVTFDSASAVVSVQASLLPGLSSLTTSMKLEAG